MKNSFRSVLVAVAFLLGGCATEYIEIDRTVPPYFHPQNVYSDPQARAAMPRTVLVLPNTGRIPTATLRELDRILIQELSKVNLFEVKSPSTEKVRVRRSEQDFTMEEAQQWAQEVGADGILIPRVTSCRTSRPLLLGTSLKLWSNPKQAVVWADDETMDSQLTLVANGARNYYLTNFRASYPARRSEVILESPSTFFQYCYAEIFGTISPTK